MGSVLKLKPSFNTLQHDTDDINLKAIADGQKINLYGKHQVTGYVDNTETLRLDVTGVRPLRALEPLSDGLVNAGQVGAQFKQGFFKSSIVTPLAFLVGAVQTDFGGGALTVNLPHEVPTADYMVIVVLDNGGWSGLCKIKVDNASKTTTQFDCIGYDWAGGVVNCTGNPTDVMFLLVFPNV